ncbi:hypothetical protein [Oceanicoccus sp. KOV_DT_Chl]|uniref:hypothetical protein n=1 Tax=Oceanicoccus sp. KOV_DT_Chl TaxID=1904639 RepID=UPI000C7C58D0|nr:hypothetical protein [Oceanicoccus sp. KOV_DT_Chl]
MPNNKIIQRFLQAPIAQKIALLTSALSLIAALVLILASYQSNRQLIEHSSTLFGESLSQQLANDASNPLVQGDKLSLQSLLNKLVESPLIVRGAIYDIQNRPVAAAGASKARGQTLSASITFQDSIAGYAIITLDTSSLHQQAFSLAWQLVILAILLAALVFLLSLFSARQFSSALKDLQVIATTPLTQRQRLHFAYRGNDEISQLANAIIKQRTTPATDVETPSPQPAAIPATVDDEAMLLIQLQDFDNLRHSHNPSQLADMLTTLQQQLNMVAKLYDGSVSVERSNSYCIRFHPKDGDNYPFRALCAGYLILLWREQHYVPLQIRAVVSLLDEIQREKSLNTIDHLFLRQKNINALEQAIGSSHQLLILNNLNTHTSVVNKAKFNTTKDKVILSNLVDPYQALINKQLTTLNAKLTKQTTGQKKSNSPVL